MKVVPLITGVGLITSLGRSPAQTWDALLGGRFISDHSRLEVTLQKPNSRVAAIGIEAADQAILQAGWTRTLSDAAVICCTSKGSVENWIGGSSRSAETVFGLADFSTAVARHTGLIQGPRLTLSAACAGGLHGLIRAAMLINSGQCSRVLVVAAEASVHPLFLGSFQRLGVLPPHGQLCRPFDQNRRGFLMSEAAAAICVESSEVASDPESIAIDRFAMGGDARHLTGSDPDGSVLGYLLAQCVGGDQMDMIHAHGTGTVSNDAVEIAAYESVLPVGPIIPVFSHKAALGHSLGASGLVAAVISSLCHQRGTVPPNINTVDPLHVSKLSISRTAEKRTIHRSIIHAAGFGGATAVVGLRSL